MVFDGVPSVIDMTMSTRQRCIGIGYGWSSLIPRFVSTCFSYVIHADIYLCILLGISTEK